MSPGRTLGRVAGGPEWRVGKYVGVVLTADERHLVAEAVPLEQAELGGIGDRDQGKDQVQHERRQQQCDGQRGPPERPHPCAALTLAACTSAMACAGVTWLPSRPCRLW